MNLRELNYILIPSAERRARSRTVRSLRWLASPVMALTREGAVLAVLTLLAGAAGVDVYHSHLYLVFCALAGLLVAAWLCRPLARCADLKIRVERPERITAGATATFTMVLSNAGARPLFALRPRGPFLPWDATWIGAPPVLAVLASGAEARLTMQAEFLCRGDRMVGQFSVASVRPLGLFRGRAVRSAPVRITVVPEVLALRGPRRPPLVHEPPEDRSRGHRPGDTFELLGVRPYRRGDRLRDLHARSWARRGVPMVREYRRAAHRTATVLLYPQQLKKDRLQLDAAVRLTASLVGYALEAEIELTLLVAGEHPIRLDLGARRGNLALALDALAAVSYSPEAPAPGPLLGETIGRAGAIWVIFTSWGPAQAEVLARATADTPNTQGFLVDAAGVQVDALKVIAPADLQRGPVTL